jgi:hypothetical protein
MEITTHEFYGEKKRPHGMASAFGNATYVKKTYCGLLRKIEKRIRQIVTADEPLKMLLLKDLEILDREAKSISKNNNNDLEIIAGLFRVVAHILGWDHLDGNFHRTVIFYQTKEQEKESLRNVSQLNLEPAGLFEAYHKRRIITRLRSEGLSYAQVALVLDMSETSVKQLEKAGHIDQIYKDRIQRHS